MNFDDDDDAEEAEVLATTHTMAPPTSDIPGTVDIHLLYERRAELYLHLSDGRKALSNAVKAVQYRNDSYTAHWLVGKSYVSMAMYDPGIGALATAIELCCLEDKRQEILIDLLVHYCTREDELSVATEVFRRIGSHTWASVAYELTKSSRFDAAYTAYSQLQRISQCPSGIHFDLQPLCDLDAVAAETWIIDLVTCFLRYGSDCNTMASQEGDTYIHVVVRMSLATGVLTLLEYVFGNVVRPAELGSLVDCLGNTALHMAAQYQNCSPLVRLDVMKLLIEAGIDQTAKNIEGKSADAYLTRDEKDCLQSHQEYNCICSGMAANKIEQAVSKTNNNSDVEKGEEDIEDLQHSTQAEHFNILERQTIKSTLDSIVSPQAYSKENDKPDTNMVNDTADLFQQNQLEESQTLTNVQNCNTPSLIKDGSNNDDDDADSQLLSTTSDESFLKDQITSNQGHTVRKEEENEKEEEDVEEKRSIRDTSISVSQHTDEHDFGNRDTDGQINPEYTPVEDAPNESKHAEFNVETIEINIKNGLPEQPVNQTTNMSSTECETKSTTVVLDDVSEVNINDENVHEEVVKTSYISDDFGCANPSLGLLDYKTNDSTPSIGTLENELACVDLELKMPLNKSTNLSSHNSSTELQSPDALKDRDGYAKVQHGSTEEDNADIESSSFLHEKADLVEAMVPDDTENVRATITSIQQNDDRDDADDIQAPRKLNDDDNPQRREKKQENERNAGELGQDIDHIEIMAKSSQESKTESHKSFRVSGNISLPSELQCGNTDQENVQSLSDKDTLLGPVSTVDDTVISAGINSIKEKCDKDDNSSQVSSANIDTSNTQPGIKTTKETCGSEPDHNTTCNKNISESSPGSVTQQQDVLLGEVMSEKIRRDSTDAVSAVDMPSSDKDYRCKSDEHGVIDHHTDEADEQQLRETSDVRSVDFDKQFDVDETSTAEDDGSEEERSSHFHPGNNHNDHDRERASDTDPPCRYNPYQTHVKVDTERKAIHKQLKQLYEKGISWLDIKQYNKGCVVFVKLLKRAPTLSRNKYISKTIDQICKYLDDSGVSDIPTDLIEVPNSHLKQILKGLLDRRKWTSFLGVVSKHGYTEKFRDLVNEICLTTVVGDERFRRNTERLKSLMKGLLDIGATLSNEGQKCIQACIKCEHYGLLPLLLSRGAHPRHLTKYPGDTPVHAALTIALQKGHFEAFELLLTKFKEDPQVYCFCDPTAKDRNGDGLLHLALREPDGSKPKKAIDLLIPHIKTSSAILSKNKKGQIPSDLIRKNHDPRWRLLEPYVCTIPAQPKRIKGKKKSRQSAHGRINVAAFPARTETLTEESKEEEKVKDVNQDGDEKEEGISQDQEDNEEDKSQEEGDTEEDKSQTKEEHGLQEEEIEEDALHEKKIEGNIKQKTIVNEDDMPDEGTENEETYEGKEKDDEEEDVETTYTKEKLLDIECKVAVGDEKVKGEPVGEDGQDVRKDERKQASSLATRPKPARYAACSICYQYMNEAKEHLRHKRTAKAYTGLAKVIRIRHKNSNSNEHRGLVDEALTLVVVSLSTTPNPEIPESLAKIPVNYYEMIINRLAKEEQWKHVDILVREHRKHHGDLSLIDFAKNISIVSVIRHPSVVEEDDLLVQIIDNMLDSGAVMENEGKSEILAAIEMEHFRLLCTLFKWGANPEFLSLQSGDTPLHAAMTIALEKDKGNFTILNFLVGKFKSDPEKFAFLDPNQKDSNGDCLFHLVARMKYNSIIQKATELLSGMEISALVYNKEGKLPKDLLVNKKNDRRLLFLQMASSETGSRSATQRQNANETQAHSSPGKVPRKDQKLIFSDTSTHRDTSRKKIEEMIFYLPDTPYSIFNPKIQKLEEVWRSQRSGGRIKGVTSPNKKDDLKEKLEETANQAGAAGAEPPQQKQQHVAIITMVDKEQEGDYDYNGKDANVAFDDLEWEVECTADVWKTLRDNHVVPELKQCIVRKVQHLAKGEWRKSLCKHVTVSEMPETLRLFEAKVSKGCSLLWEQAITFSPRLSDPAERRLNVGKEGEDLVVRGGRIYSEVIRLWDIVFDPDSIHRCVERIIKSHTRGEGCIIQKKLKGLEQSQHQETEGKHFPTKYVEAESQEQDQRELQRFYPPASSNDTEYHILKFYSFSSNLVYHVLHNTETKVDFPFRVTDLEQAIINLKSQAPILLLGRSGTGKTTCCLYRLWTQFRSYWSEAIQVDSKLLPRLVYRRLAEEEDEEDKDENEEEEEDPLAELLGATVGADGKVVEENGEEKEDQGQIYDHLHQIFITKNAVLCNEVQKNFRELNHAYTTTNKDVEPKDPVLPPRLQDIVDDDFPLFITSKQLLLMLDASLGQPYFFERGEDGGLKVDVQGWTDGEGLRSILPLLAEESDDEDVDDEMFNDFKDDDNDIQATKVKVDSRREVTYDVFSEEIWPKICKKFGGKYHPSLVWTEIMSFIKGSYEALSKPSGFLEKEEYLEVGKKRAPNFSGKRTDIYDLFERYDHFKKQKFLFDETDLVHSIHKRLHCEANIPWIIHQVFVDETQDFTQAELFLLLRICQDPNQMFLTGDTAQSIMRGIAFRFNDLKSIFFYAKPSLQAVGNASDIEVPKRVYQLTHNYRSHAGILYLASSILDLMVRFFPDSFDRLEKDQGLFNGPLPVLLESCSFSDLAMLLRGSRRKTSHIECGAHQAILVVDEASRDSIPEELQLGLILTIYEAKGLEFDDILLYNFFKDSKASKEWRVVTEYLEELATGTKGAKGDNSPSHQESLVQIDADVLQQTNRPRALQFDASQHKVLNSELKHLYTAVTRARVNVWIFDEDQDKRAPMFEYFKARKLVKILHQSDTDEDDTETIGGVFAEESSQENWIKRGEDFMKHALYEVAAKCFIRGGDRQLHDVALAYQQALKASRTKDSHQRMRDEFLFAAEMFLDCSLPSFAAKCLQNARERELGAHLFEKIGLPERAGEIYQKMKRPIEESRCYEQLGNFNLAIETLCEKECYDVAIDTLSRYRKLVQDLQSKHEPVPGVLLDNAPGELRTRERLSYMAAEFHHRNNNKARMMANLERLEHVSDQIAFLKKKGYFDEAAQLLQNDEKYEDAIDIYLMYGKSQEAQETARLSGNKELIGKCLLINAQVIIRRRQERILSDEQTNEQTENKRSDEEKKSKDDEVLKILQQAIDILLNTSNPEQRGEACFLKGEITNDVTDINESWGAFNKCNPRCEAGQLECMDWMVRNSDLNDFRNRLQVVKGMQNLFGVLNLLVSTDKDGGDRVYKYYGLRPTSDGSLKMFPQQRPRAMTIMKRCLNKAESLKTECEVPRNVARDAICRFLLHRGHYWFCEVTLALNKLKRQREQCREFILGRNCTGAADGGECLALHDVMTERNLRNLIDVDLLHIEMDWYVHQGCDRLLHGIAFDLTDMVNVFLQDTANDHLACFKSCEDLLQHMMPSEHFTFRMTEQGLEHANKLQSHICKVYKGGQMKLRKHIKGQMSTYLIALYDQMIKKKKSSNVVFMKLPFLATYFQLKDINASNMMMKFETEVRKENLKKNKADIKKRLEQMGFLVDDRDMRNISVQCVARRFHDAYHELPINPQEALTKFTKFIEILGDRNQSELLPCLSDFLMWMEYFTTVAVCFGAKYNLVTDVFFLPASYLSLVYFIDSSFKGQPTFRLIQRHSTIKRHTLTLSQERAESIIGVLCGSKIRMNLIRLLFRVQKDRTMDYGLAERLLVLCMTVLCNMGKALFPNKEAALMQQLCLIALPEDCPDRLLKAVRAVQEADGLSDIAAALTELLYDREQEDVRLCHWHSLDRFGVKSTRLDNLAFLPSKFFNANTKQIMTNPGQDGMNPEEDGDADNRSLVRLDTDMTMEEKIKWEREQKRYEENLRKENAALIITRFFKKIRFRLQCSILHCLVEEELQKEETEKHPKKFKLFDINDRACTICDVIFDKPSGSLIEDQSFAESFADGANRGSDFDKTKTSSVPFSGSVQDIPAEKWPETSEDITGFREDTGNDLYSEEIQRSKQKLLHEQSDWHSQNMNDFKQFQFIYKTEIESRQEEIVEFIRNHDLRTETGLQNFADVKLDLTRLVNQSDKLQNEFERILAKRDWGNTTLLTQLFREANSCFLSVKPYVEEQRRKLREATNDKTAEGSKARNSQPSHGEDRDEEIQLLEDVVQEPFRQREKKGRRRGRGRGRARHQEN